MGRACGADSCHGWMCLDRLRVSLGPELRVYIYTSRSLLIRFHNYLLNILNWSGLSNQGTIEGRLYFWGAIWTLIFVKDFCHTYWFTQFCSLWTIECSHHWSIKLSIIKEILWWNIFLVIYIHEYNTILHTYDCWFHIKICHLNSKEAFMYDVECHKQAWQQQQ